MVFDPQGLLSGLQPGAAAFFLSSWGLDLNVCLDMPNTTSKRIIFFTSVYFGFLVLVAFNAGLTSTLTIEVTDVPIQGLKDLESREGYSLHVLKGGATEAYLQGSKEAQAVLSRGQVRDYESLYTAEERMIEDETYITFSVGVFSDLVFDPCRITESPERYNIHDIGLPFKKDSPYLDLFNHQIGRLLDSGLYRKLVEDTRRHRGDEQCDARQKLKPISYHNIIAVFIVVSVGVGLSLCALLIELTVAKVYKKFPPPTVPISQFSSLSNTRSSTVTVTSCKSK